ncbi:phosphoinositide 3-kinase [Botrytis cinerea]
MEPFSFASSEALDIPVNIRIVNLEGEQTPIPFSTLINRPDLRHIGSNLSPHSDLYVTVQLWADSKPLTVPVQTAYKSFKNERNCDHCMGFIPTGGDGAQGHAVPFGGTTLRLFDKDNQLQKGRQKCHLHRRKAADGLDSSSTPAVLPNVRRNGSKSKEEAEIIDKEGEELDRLEKLFKKHEMGEIARIEWLDQLVFRGVEKRGLQASSNSLKNIQRRRTRQKSVILTLDGVGEKNNDVGHDLSEDHPSKDERFTLHVELPRFDFPVVFADHEYPPPPISSLQNLSSSQSNIILKPPPQVQFGPGINGFGDSDEHGFSGRLVRVYDPEVGARDNPAESKHRRLVRSHRTGVLDRDLKPNAKEKDLVWKFRHHLARDKRALTKFIKSVNWNDPNEAREAVAMLSKWTEIDVDDALELLGPTFENSSVRTYAVDRLRKSDDDELLLYLLQLVQALKFEHISPDSAEDAAQDSSLARLLISRATNNFQLGNLFHWYLMVECDDKSEDQGAGYRKLFAKVEYDFMTELVKNPEGVETRKVLLRQAELITMLSRVSEDIKSSRDTVSRKAEKVKQFLADPKNELITIDPPLPLPLDPSIMITGVDPSETNVFKSSLFPIMITFKTTTKQKYQIIFKTGDDLRQDQLVIQIITLMDQLLQKENLDLKLSPYKILATGATAGAVQFVPSMTLQSIVNKFKGNTVLNYLKSNNPDDKASLGVRKEALDVDPKPFAPAMKLCKEMVDGMGGSMSEHYPQFKQYCFTAYTTLRKSSNLILNLFSLMVDANIPDIKIEPDKVVLKVKERFHLELSEEDAIRHFERLIEDSANAIFPVVIDRLHGFVQHFR